MSPESHVTAVTIPPGAPGKRCRLCGVLIFFALHPSSGKPHPVSCNGTLLADARPPQRDRPGVGVSHFSDCVVHLRQQEVIRERREAERRVLLEQQPELNL